MSQSESLITCARCGAVGGEQPPLDWVLGTDAGRSEAYCPRCARENLRAIEARLDPAYW